MSELVSVIVPTRNSAETLAACLRSVQRQTHAAIECVVVDNASTDATPPIARRLADMFVEAGPERSAQRNAGAHRAHGTYLMFIDSDMILESTVVAEAVAEGHAGCAAVVLPERSFGDGVWARAKALERSCYIGDPTIEAARFFSRSVFEQAGGYDENILAGPEDWDLHERVRGLGGTLGRTRAFIRHDEGCLRLRDTILTKYYYGKSTAAYIRRHPELARRQLKVVRPAFIRHWRLLLREPPVAAAMLLMKSLEMGAGAAGLISARIRRRKLAAGCG